MPFYDKYAEICFIIESKKRAKKRLDEAQQVYDECCKVATAKEEDLLRILRE